MLVVAMLLACKDSPPAPITGPGVPTAAVPAPRWPAELLGAWVSLDDLDGRWVVSVPCTHGAAVLEFADAPGAGRMHWSHGASEDDWTLATITPGTDAYAIDVRPSAGAPERHNVVFLDASKARITIDDTGPFVRAQEAEWIEHIYQSPADCGATTESPWGSIGSAPEALYRLVWMDGAWRQPPDSGTAPGLVITTLETPPELKRRTGAGERSYPLISARRDGDIFWLTVAGTGAVRTGVTIRPWGVPPSGLPALPIPPSGNPAAPVVAPPPTPPPPGAYLVTFGPEGVDPNSAWVTELPR